MADCPGTNPILVANIGVQREDNKLESAFASEDDAVTALFLLPDNDNNRTTTAATAVDFLNDNNN
jgi:hypothetical protein